MSRYASRLILGCIALSSLALLAGCLETKYSLGSGDGSKVNLAYVGDWAVQSKDEANPSHERIIIRNIDGKQYYVGYENGDADHSLQMIGYAVDVNGATFAQLRGMPADGAISDTHLILRVELKDGKLILRNLNEDFFKSREISSDAQLRKLVEDNLDNDAMYDKDTAVATKILKK